MLPSNNLQVISLIDNHAFCPKTSSCASQSFTSTLVRYIAASYQWCQLALYWKGHGNLVFLEKQISFTGNDFRIGADHYTLVEGAQTVSNIHWRREKGRFSKQIKLRVFTAGNRSLSIHGLDSAGLGCNKVQSNCKGRRNVPVHRSCLYSSKGDLLDIHSKWWLLVSICRSTDMQKATLLKRYCSVWHTVEFLLACLQARQIRRAVSKVQQTTSTAERVLCSRIHSRAISFLLSGWVVKTRCTDCILCSTHIKKKTAHSMWIRTKIWVNRTLILYAQNGPAWQFCFGWWSCICQRRWSAAPPSSVVQELFNSVILPSALVFKCFASIALHICF